MTYIGYENIGYETHQKSRTQLGSKTRSMYRDDLVSESRSKVIESENPRVPDRHFAVLHYMKLNILKDSCLTQSHQSPQAFGPCALVMSSPHGPEPTLASTSCFVP